MPDSSNQHAIESLAIKNEISEIGRVTEWLHWAVAKFQLDEDIGFKLDLGANEAIANTISYGYPNGEKDPIDLTLTRESTRISLEMRDRGIAFNPLEYPEIMLPKHLEDAPVGGFGIQLIRKFMDRCSYRREDQTNIFCLTLNIN